MFSERFFATIVWTAFLFILFTCYRNPVANERTPSTWFPGNAPPRTHSFPFFPVCYPPVTLVQSSIDTVGMKNISLLISALIIFTLGQSESWYLNLNFPLNLSNSSGPLGRGLKVKILSRWIKILSRIKSIFRRWIRRIFRRIHRHYIVGDTNWM